MRDCKLPPAGVSSLCVIPKPSPSKRKSCVSNPAPPTVVAENDARSVIWIAKTSTSFGDEIDPLMTFRSPEPEVGWPGTRSGASPCSVQVLLLVPLGQNEHPASWIV